MLVHAQVEGGFGNWPGAWWLRNMTLPTVSMGDCRGYECCGVIDILDVGVNGVIKCFFVFTICFLFVCFPGMCAPWNGTTGVVPSTRCSTRFLVTCSNSIFDQLPI